jgi:hypothetical protein
MDVPLLLGGFVMLALGAGMAAYERSRVKAKRPLFGGRQVPTLYWCAYLALLVLGLTTPWPPWCEANGSPNPAGLLCRDCEHSR